MGEAGLAVLIMVLLVGLITALLVPWFTVLVSTGHPPRRVTSEVGPPVPRRRSRERYTGRAALGMVLAVVATALLLALMVPYLAADVPLVEDLPRPSLVLAFSAFIVSVAFALPSWLGVGR